MPTYFVCWEIDIEADNARAAAEQARAIQLLPESTATVFLVGAAADNLEKVDLLEPTDTQCDELARAAGWDHGGDFDGFWYNTRECESWKAAASSGDTATFATSREVCAYEGLDTSDLPQPAPALQASRAYRPAYSLFRREHPDSRFAQLPYFADCLEGAKEIAEAIFTEGGNAKEWAEETCTDPAARRSWLCDFGAVEIQIVEGV